MPQRIQLSRKKGWSLPENTINVARPGRWGNCYKIGMPAPSWMHKEKLETIEDVVDAHERMCLVLPGKLMEIQAYLRGRNLACWCGLDQPCHRDTLLRLANSRDPEHVAVLECWCGPTQDPRDETVIIHRELQ